MQRPRLLLLTTAHSYRNEAFQAGRRPGGGRDRRRLRPAPGDAGRGTAASSPAGWASTWPTRGGGRRRSRALRPAEQPLAAVLPVDDSGVVAAAAVAAGLGLPYNAPAAAEAARDKYRMRTLMAAAGVPCPWFRRFSTGDDLAAGRRARCPTPAWSSRRASTAAAG